MRAGPTLMDLAPPCNHMLGHSLQWPECNFTSLCERAPLKVEKYKFFQIKNISKSSRCTCHLCDTWKWLWDFYNDVVNVKSISYCEHDIICMALIALMCQLQIITWILQMWGPPRKLQNVFKKDYLVMHKYPGGILAPSHSVQSLLEQFTWN